MKKIPKRGILIALGELFLKSERVREIFERTLIKNISFFLKKENLNFRIYRLRTRIFVEVNQSRKALTVLKNIFGISWLADSFFFEKTTIKEFSTFLAKNYQNWIKEEETFAIRLKKEGIKENREEIIDEITKMIKRKVNLSSPKKEIFVEIRKNNWFLYFKKIKSQGGLPVGTSGKVLSFISGGIDSSVAAFLITKRGAESVWLHFHSFPLVSKASIEKIKELAKVFLNYQPHLKIYLIPFQTAQIEIKIKTPTKYRILLYRRLMFKIAEKIAKKENCPALVTGESLAQVSSQTLPNLNIIEKGIKLSILRPLIGIDKEEIINLAKKIKTFQISIKHQEDCCTLFAPKHQTAEGNLKTIKELEKKLKIKKIIQEILEKVEIVKY